MTHRKYDTVINPVTLIIFIMCLMFWFVVGQIIF
jgi:hypothetical protein